MIDVVCPYDQSLVKTLAQQTRDDAQAMLSTAQALFKRREAWLAPHKRIAILSKLAELVAQEADAFAELIATEGGKPLKDAKVEVVRAIDGIKLAIKELPHAVRGEEIPMGLTEATVNREAATTYEPIGVVLALSAFNHPLNLIVHQVIPAVAVGCPVIVKPASTTPLNCLRLCELLYQAGLPKAWCQTILCDNDVAEFLASSDQIQFMTFIGSARVGWSLKSKLAPGTRCALEHGGVAPVILAEDAQLDRAIPALLKGGFYHAGQVCVSVQRIYAPAQHAKEIATRLAEGAEKLTVGDARSPDTDVGPLIRPKEVNRVNDWVNEAIKGGASLLCGGKKLGATTYAPTVLLDPPEDANVSTQEVFGPVVCVYSYHSHQDAIDRANSLDVAFQAAIFTQDMHTAQKLASQIDAATVMINDHTAFRADWMPFAGRRTSGYGIGGIAYTMHDMVNHKLIVNKLESS